LRNLVQQVSGSTPTTTPTVPPMPSPGPVVPSPIPSPAPTVPTPSPTSTHAPMMFNAISIDPTSTNIERNTANPQITLVGTTLNSHIQVADVGGRILYS